MAQLAQNSVRTTRSTGNNTDTELRHSRPAPVGGLVGIGPDSDVDIEVLVPRRTGAHSQIRTPEPRHTQARYHQAWQPRAISGITHWHRLIEPRRPELIN